MSKIASPAGRGGGAADGEGKPLGNPPSKPFDKGTCQPSPAEKVSRKCVTDEEIIFVKYY